MSDNRIEQLIDQALNSDQLSEQAREDFEDFRADLQEGELAPEDVAYIEQFCARLGIGGTADPEAPAAPQKTIAGLCEDALESEDPDDLADALDAALRLIRAEGLADRPVP